MMKRILILIMIFSLGILLVGIFLYEKNISKKVYDRNISNRSKKFINRHLKDVVRKNAGPITPTQLNTEGCFTMVIPFLISSSRQDGPCDWHYAVASPKMNIIVYQRPVSYADINEDTGITLRRSRNTLYTESKLTINKHSYIVFHKKEGAYEVNAFTKQEGSIFVINIIGYSSKNLDDELNKLLSTVTFL